jgi:4-amino-4-deoxy-L-arabinose transferase-like glycosyltransferase
MPKRSSRKKQDAPAPQRHLVLAPFLFVAVALSVLFTADDYGITTDEPIYMGQGQRIAGWLRDSATSFANRDFLTPFRKEIVDKAWYAGKDQQPPLVKALSGILGMVLPGGLGATAPLRAPGAILFAAAVTALYIFCSARWRVRAGLAAALSLFLLPRAFAHAHYATLDIPVASLALLTALAFWKTGETGRWGWAVLTGLLFGLALLAKLNALLLLPALLLWSVIWQRKAMLMKAVAMVAIGPAAFLLGWPWLWHSPILRFVDYVTFHVSHYPVDVYYLGKTYHYAPWHYPFVLTGVTVPVAVLALMVIGILVALARARHGSAETLLLVMAAAHLLVSALPQAPKYNGVRLFMPAFPFLAGLAGLGFERFTAAVESALQRLPALARWVAPLAGIGIFASAAVAVVGTHPYQLAYYNALVGGMKGARKAGLETIYWGGPYLQAVERLNRKPATIYVIPRGAVSYLEVYQNAGALRRDLQFRARVPDPAENLAQLKECDLVIFQCAQSEFDDIAWALYRRGKPAWGIRLNGVPLLLAFDARQAVEVIENAGR